MILGFLDFINSDIYFSNFNKFPHSVIFVFLGIIGKTMFFDCFFL